MTAGWMRRVGDSEHVGHAGMMELVMLSITVSIPCMTAAEALVLQLVLLLFLMVLWMLILLMLLVLLLMLLLLLLLVKLLMLLPVLLMPQLIMLVLNAWLLL